MWLDFSRKGRGRCAHTQQSGWMWLRRLWSERARILCKGLWILLGRSDWRRSDEVLGSWPSDQVPPCLLPSRKPGEIFVNSQIYLLISTPGVSSWQHQVGRGETLMPSQQDRHNSNFQEYWLMLNCWSSEQWRSRRWRVNRRRTATLPVARSSSRQARLPCTGHRLPPRSRAEWPRARCSDTRALPGLQVSFWPHRKVRKQECQQTLLSRPPPSESGISDFCFDHFHQAEELQLQRRQSWGKL